MKLLIITQKVDQNDSVLGFFHRWIEEFAKHCESVLVICLQKGDYNLPANVRVLTLGKDNGVSRLKYLANFFRYIWRERKNYDSVFVHMNPEYVVLGGCFWKILGKKVSLWYVHRQVNLKLRIATLFCKNIFSVSPESFRLKNKKVRFVGHGIDTEFFKCENRKKENDEFKIISVGRITKIKNLEILVKSIKNLSEDLLKKIKIDIIGSPVTNLDHDYKSKLEKMVVDNKLESIINFFPALPYGQMAKVYCQSDLLVNLCPTGGADKVVLESLSCNCPVLVSNEVFKQYLGEKNEEYCFRQGDDKDLSDKIKKAIVQRRLANDSLRRQIIDKHDLGRLVNKVLSFI